MPGPGVKAVCRGCGHDTATLVLDLGAQPPANDFVRPQDAAAEEFRAPLRLVQCEGCRLLQLGDRVAPERLFLHSPWRAGGSATLRQHVAWLARRIAERCPPERHRTLVELMCNDGTGLEAFRAAGYDVQGVDPSVAAADAADRGLPVVRRFFDHGAARHIRAARGPADVLVAWHALHHADDVRELLLAARDLLHHDGRFVIEAPYALVLRDELQYDTVFHEHATYWTVTTLVHTLARHGFTVTDVTFTPVNGGSLLAEAAVGAAEPSPSVQAVQELEQVLKLNHPAGWADFTRRVDGQKADLLALLRSLTAAGRKVAGYGAAAKFMTMLNYCGVTPDVLPVVADAGREKQGTLCPGVRVPVVSPQELFDFDPDYVLVGPWNLHAEIVRYLRGLGYRNRFLTPLPSPRFTDV